MANGKSHTARRREVRRNLPRTDPKWMRPIQRREAIWTTLYLVLFVLVTSLVAIPDNVRFRYEAGQVVDQPIVSRVQFDAIDLQATEERRTEAMNREPRVFVPNQAYLESVRERFAGLMALADQDSLEQIASETREQLQLTRRGLDELRRFADPTSEPTIENWHERIDAFLQGMFDLAVLEPEQYRARTDPRTAVGRIIIFHPNPREGHSREQARYGNVLISVDDRTTFQKNIEPLTVRFPPALRDTVVAVVMQSPEPTYVFNSEARELSQQRRQDRYDREPAVVVTHEPNDMLVAAGTELTTAHLDLFEAERAAYREQLSQVQRMLQPMAIVGLMLVLGLAVWGYIIHYNDRVVRNPMRGFALMALLLLCHALAVWLTQVQPGLLYVTALFPTLLVAIVLTIAYDQRFALAIGGLHALLVVMSLALTPGFALVMLTGVAAAAALLNDVRSRSTVVLVGVWSGLAMGGAAMLTGLFERPLHLGGAYQQLLYDAAMAVATGGATGLVVQGMLPSIEKAFRVTTAMTLRELNDASHPLLQRLAQEAPGTYQHSLRIADIGEAAADAINANSLLCRVGAMYHDIGKVNKPQYFIENQSGGPNRHNKLSPAMSLLIIVGHVKDGIEMAREYHLPADIRHFIESHHGTTLVEYFYHAARKQKEAEEAPGPSEFEFRYPGPKPQTKEAAIMLLCDSIEAAARSLPEPTPVRLEQIVHRMATKRLMDGQFDECNLTLAELHRIEQAITKMLCAIYHGRIKYPTANRDDDQQERGDTREAALAVTPQADQPPQPQTAAS
ncbi:HD family phosphohydrolase [Phycisphaerales bacterium AB-hyl4]|uniref:HD family phosphohydrolase n=1 Tax=Natronomicrosphaera hydrolytica TaxID=3242702 RepID=A0ABV4U3J5_9BACT